MKERIKGFFTSLLTQDMGKQARQVEFLTLIVFVVLLVVAGWLWQFKIDLTAPAEGGARRGVGQMNIFELLVSKK